jgi:hypothetical protein
MRRDNPPGLIPLIASVTALKAAAVLLFLRQSTAQEDAKMALGLFQTGAFVFRHLGVDNHSYQFPIYPMLVAGSYRVLGTQPVAAILLNLLLNALTAWVLVRVLAEFFDRIDVAGRMRWARTPTLWVCLVAFLLHPFISYYAMHDIHPLALDLLLFYAPLLLVFRYFDRGNRTIDLALLGIATGFVLLQRTVLIVNLLPFFVLAAASFGWRSAMRRTAFVVSVALLVGVPWLVRNYCADRILGYTSTTGEILWKGSLRNSDGSNFLLDGRPYISALSSEEMQRVSTLSVAEQNRFFMSRYVESLREEPGRVAWMFLIKLRNFFWFRSLVGSQYSASIRRLMPLYQVPYAAVLVLALLSIPRLGTASLPVWSLIVGLGIFQSVFYVETRHRVVVEPLLVFLATLSVASFWPTPRGVSTRSA